MIELVCSCCGIEMNADSSWRFNGDGWEHKCPSNMVQAGYFSAIRLDEYISQLKQRAEAAERLTGMQAKELGRLKAIIESAVVDERERCKQIVANTALVGAWGVYDAQATLDYAVVRIDNPEF